MAVLRSRMRVLIAEKGLRERRKITLAVVERETGLSKPTILKMTGNEIGQIKGETIVRLCEYFGCTVGDLLYVDEE